MSTRAAPTKPWANLYRFIARQLSIAIFLIGVLRDIIHYRLDLLINPSIIPSRSLRWLLNTLRRVLTQPKLSMGARLCQALIKRGPVYIKIGQLLATRRDVLPIHISEPLANLQDNVPPEPNFSILDHLDRELSPSQRAIIQDIDPTPLASASIAMIYRAKLAEPVGMHVVLKVTRTDLDVEINREMHKLKRFAQMLEGYLEIGPRLELSQILEDHHQVLLQETDLSHEAINQLKLRKNFAGSDLLYVPRVFSEFSTKNLLVMEYIEAPSIGDMNVLAAAHVNLKVLAHKGVATFFKQVFDDNFFHADMHAGNIKVDISDPNNPRYIALDCAIIGSLSDITRHYLARNLVAFFQQDFEQVAKLHLDAGWVPKDTDLDAYTQIIRDLILPLQHLPLAQISIGAVVTDLFNAARQFNVHAQPELVLLQKTLLYIEGLGRSLYPQLDLWETAAPYMDQWMLEQISPAQVISSWVDQNAYQWERLLKLPNTLDNQDENLRQLSKSVTILERQLQAINRKSQTLKIRSRWQTAVLITLLLILSSNL